MREQEAISLYSIKGPSSTQIFWVRFAICRSPHRLTRTQRDRMNVSLRYRLAF